MNFLSAPVKDGTTGTVIVLTTPDAHRTMLAYQVSSISDNKRVIYGVTITVFEILSKHVIKFTVML